MCKTVYTLTNLFLFRNFGAVAQIQLTADGNKFADVWSEVRRSIIPCLEVQSLRPVGQKKTTGRSIVRVYANNCGAFAEIWTFVWRFGICREFAILRGGGAKQYVGWHVKCPSPLTNFNQIFSFIQFFSLHRRLCASDTGFERALTQHNYCACNGATLMPYRFYSYNRKPTLTFLIATYTLLALFQIYT